MKIEKIIVLSLIAIILLGNFCLSNAETSNVKSDLVDVKIELSENKDELYVTVSVKKNEYGVMGMQGKFEFNSKELTFEKSESLLENFNITASNKETGNFLIEIDDESFFDETKYLSEDTDLAKFTFKVNDGVSKIPISLNEIKLVYEDNSNYKTVDCNEFSTDIRINYNDIITIICVVFILIAILVLAVYSRKKR